MLVAVASNTHKNAEIFEDGAWTDIQQPPVGEHFSRYAVLYDAGNFYYFGGWGDSSDLSLILRLDAATWTWSNVGQLNSSRHAHGVIQAGNTFMVIGGGGVRKNEACVLNNGQFTCEEKTSSLESYAYYPLMSLINDTFGLC